MVRFMLVTDSVQNHRGGVVVAMVVDAVGAVPVDAILVSITLSREINGRPRQNHADAQPIHTVFPF